MKKNRDKHLSQFHETWRMENMFKKTLLALAVAGTSLSATAGVLTVDVKEGADTAAYTTVDALDSGNANQAVNACAQAATALGVSVTLNGQTPNNTANNDDITITNTKNGTFSSTSSVTYTGADACTVVIADQKISATTAKYSLESAQAKGVEINATQIAGIGGYTEEDTISFEVTGGVVNEQASLNAKLESIGTTGVAGTNARGSFTLLGVVGNKILFTVDTGYNGAANEMLRLTGVYVTPNTGVTEVSVASEVQNTANVKYDITPAEKLANLAKQYSAKVHVKGDGIVDVQKDRFEFEANTKDTSDTFLATDESKTGLLNQDTFVVEVTENTTLGNLTPKSGNIVVKGNFSWLKDFAGTDGKLSSAEIASALTLTSFDDLETTGATIGQAKTAGDDVFDTAKLKLNDAMNELTIPVASGADNDIDKYHQVSFKVKGANQNPAAVVALSETTYTASIDFINNKTADNTTSDVALNVVTDAEVAQWTLNGSVVNVPYIPFGPNTQPIIRHTNKGVQTGDISVRYMVEGSSGNTETNEWKPLGVIIEDAKPGVRNLLDIITEKLTAELGNDQFKVALEITTNVPKEDVTVFAAAKITAEGQDRVTIGAFNGQ
ncbi:hypothetical protein CBQ28_03700 [Pseudoalteromonas sp. GCY]|uniref:hypothetical protein n=1 Tax=Pseudoalteromonas sp. GCY TaxID=2003316 RepID=UPI000BFEF451|nr:hypothetical protein [Pseudoalteromonas sp. GCY]PHI38633.1 hypothetical protein CBQ28_03700 [Pseudoalteromonas sp. GCY]QQQ67725.1 hypothetical protein JJQ94_07905 [Pseudoalteromonas sp. GCY]